MEITERIIIEQLKRGNEEAYKYLYRHHYALLCHIAREYVGDDFLAEMLVGDVIFHLWEVHETLDIQVSLRSYLVRAVRNHCMDYLSSKKERTEVAFSSILEEGEMRYLLSDDYPLGSLLEHELEEEIHHAIRNLPEVCRKVFIKSRFEGKKYEEIATELNISVNTVKYHIKSALSSLHSELGKYLIILILFLHHLESFSGDKYVPKKIVPKAASGTIGFDKNAVIISFLSASHVFHQAMFLRPKVL